VVNPTVFILRLTSYMDLVYSCKWRKIPEWTKLPSV